MGLLKRKEERLDDNWLFRMGLIVEGEGTAESKAMYLQRNAVELVEEGHHVDALVKLTEGIENPGHRAETLICFAETRRARTVRQGDTVELSRQEAQQYTQEAVRVLARAEIDQYDRRDS